MLHVTISRSFAARFGHVVNHLLALRARQGASYSGGRLGVAAAEVLVASVLITFHPPRNCKAETARGGRSGVNCCENEVKVRYRTASFG
jgi:hypothetical protein